MKIKRLGRTGLKVSEICLGTMTFGNQCDEPTSRAIMDKAFDYGVTFFDTADAYPIGHGMRNEFALRSRTGTRRVLPGSHVCLKAGPRLMTLSMTLS